MWLQNLLLLGTVVCIFSAPTHLPSSEVTQPWKRMDLTAIREAQKLLEHSEDPPDLDKLVEIVSGKFDVQEPTCLQTRLEMYKQGLRGNLTALEGHLTLIADYYQKNCPTPETSCETEETNFRGFKENLKEFLIDIPLDCWKSAKK